MVHRASSLNGKHELTESIYEYIWWCYLHVIEYLGTFANLSPLLSLPDNESWFLPLSPRGSVTSMFFSLGSDWQQCFLSYPPVCVWKCPNLYLKELLVTQTSSRTLFSSTANLLKVLRTKLHSMADQLFCSAASRLWLLSLPIWEHNSLKSSLNAYI